MSKTRPDRFTLDKALALGGVIVILLQVLLIADLRWQVAVVLVGILINQVGVWGLAARLMPDRRTNLRLRSEVDVFIGLVRKLSGQSGRKDGSAFDTTTAELHEAVDRIASTVASDQEEGPAEA